MRAVITVDHDPRILELFAPEDKTMNRGSYAVSDEGDHIAFTIQAEDATALRALLNAVTKLLSLWERSENV